MPETAADTLDQFVIEMLGVVHDTAGADTFDDAATRLVVSVCAMLLHERGRDRVRDVVESVAAGLPNNDGAVFNWSAITAAVAGGRTAGQT
jgi:hypothetical protein